MPTYKTNPKSGFFFFCFCQKTQAPLKWEAVLSCEPCAKSLMTDYLTFLRHRQVLRWVLLTSTSGAEWMVWKTGTFLLPVFSRSLPSSGKSFKMVLQVLSHSLCATSCFTIGKRLSLLLPPPRHPMRDCLHVRLSWELLMRDPRVGKALLFNRCESVSNRGHRGPPMCWHGRSLSWPFYPWCFHVDTALSEVTW